jgi:hypothetical protein
MVKHPIHLVAIAAVALLGAATQAGAQCCEGPGTVVAGPVIVAGPQSRLVNQGPVHSGPGHFVEQYSDPPPRRYPYVGFVFSGYPYGYHNPYVGAPRRFYRPW